MNSKRVMLETIAIGGRCDEKKVDVENASDKENN